MHPELERFVRLLDDDVALREELWSITEPMQFVGAVVRHASEHGIMIVDGEVWEAFSAGRTSWLATQAP